MNWAHLHLMLNHIPILGSFLIPIFVLISIRKKDKQLLKISFQMMTLIGFLTLPAYFTGEPSEKLIEHLPGVSETLINKHEYSAIYGLIVTEILSVLGIAGLVLLRRNFECALRLLKSILVLSVINILLMAWIANLGGEIRHTEIRSLGLAVSRNHDHSEPS